MRFFCFILSLFFLFGQSMAFAEEGLLDFSVDSTIKKQYNTKAIEDDLLPPLPKTYEDKDGQDYTKFDVEEINIPKKTTMYSKITEQTIDNANMRKIAAGKKFVVKSLSAVSSSTPKGAKVTFESVYPVQFVSFSVPAKTKFRGVVMDSHKPQLTGNGGLIVIKVNEIVYNNQSFPIDAKITLADDKKIFLNNIKGERKYIKNMSKPIKPAGRFMAKAWKTTCRLSHGLPEAVLTPVTLLSGVVVYTGSVAISPVVSVFYKGNSISIPTGTRYDIKLREDAFVY